MGFVKTPEEVKEIQALLSKGRFTVESVSIEFETTFEFLRKVLPPCFELPEKPTAIANVSRWQSALCGEFDCGVIYLNCRYKEFSGTTMLTLFVSGDMPVTIGREMWGEGKKLASSQLYFDGKDAYGYTERNGVRLIEIDAEFGPDLGPLETSNYDFEIKAQPHVTGIGLQNDVVLNCMKTEESYRVTRVGKGTLKLTGTPMDPLETIPVVSVGEAFYAEGASSWTVPWFDELPDRDAYVPYIYGQKYDDFRFFAKPKRFAE